MDLAVLGCRPRQEIGGGGLHRVGIAETQSHESPLGLVGDGVSPELDDHREAELPGRRHGGGRVGHHPFLRERDPEGTQQVLGVLLGQGGVRRRHGFPR